jgi:hypothetical protein
MHAHIHTYTHIHNTDIYTYIHTHIHIDTHTYIIQTYTHAYIHTHRHTYMHKHMHNARRTSRFIRIHTPKRTRSYTHTHHRTCTVYTIRVQKTSRCSRTRVRVRCTHAYMHAMRMHVLLLDHIARIRSVHIRRTRAYYTVSTCEKTEEYVFFFVVFFVVFGFFSVPLTLLLCVSSLSSDGGAWSLISPFPLLLSFRLSSPSQAPAGPHLPSPAPSPVVCAEIQSSPPPSAALLPPIYSASFFSSGNPSSKPRLRFPCWRAAALPLSSPSGSFQASCWIER